MKYEDCRCRTRKRAKITKEIIIAGHRILVRDAPGRICEECGEAYFDGKYIEEIEREVLEKDKAF